MARPPRIQQPEAWYHVMARAIEERALYRQDRDYEHFLELLESFSKRFACNISAYVLMPNHFHLFLQTMEPNLSRAVQWLTTSYAAWLNARQNRKGHLFQGRFKAIVVDPEEWAVSLTRYIHLNPVRVRRLGLDKSARAASKMGRATEAPDNVIQERIKLLRSFRWSSYRAYGGYEAGAKWLQADWILVRCGRSALERRGWYRDYCEEAVREGREDDIGEHVLQQLFLGGREFLKEVLKKSGHLAAAGERPGWKEIQAAIERLDGKSRVKRGGDWRRDLALYLMRENGHPLPVAAKAAGMKRAPTAGMAIHRFERRLGSDKALRELAERVRRTLK